MTDACAINANHHLRSDPVSSIFLYMMGSNLIPFCQSSPTSNLPLQPNLTEMFSSLTPNANSAKKRSDIIIYGATGNEQEWDLQVGRETALSLSGNLQTSLSSSSNSNTPLLNATQRFYW